ncbi:MAG: M20/M25/M40 family metallo-hydrolase [Phycisphaerales bacterium]|nr:M20/M25/M40 family metallo-hydrolase [Phycisphaerales bacterium]
MTDASTRSPVTAEPLSDAERKLTMSIMARWSKLLGDLTELVNIPTGRAPHPIAVEGLNRTRTLLRARLEKLGANCDFIPGDPRPAWLDRVGQVSSLPDRVGQVSNLPSTPPPTLVARRLATKSDRRPILLSGHLDTVHDPSPDAPFRTLTVSADKTKATGPGVVDMKGGLVIALHALEALADAGIDVPFGFILNSDEETGSFSSDRALRAEASRTDRAGARLYSCALALEPANGTNGLVTSRGGSGQCMIEAKGRAAHVGRDFASGRSATDLLARMIIAGHKLTNPITGDIVNFSTLFCDQPPNQVADHAAAWGNLRYHTQESGEKLAAAIQRLCAERTTPADGRTITAAVSLIRPAKPGTPETLALAYQVQAIAAVLGQPVTFSTTSGVCDGNNLQAGLDGWHRSPTGAGSHGSPTRDSQPPAPLPPFPVLDTLGVRGGGLHTPQEWIDLASLVERCQLLAILLSRLSNAGAVGC